MLPTFRQSPSYTLFQLSHHLRCPQLPIAQSYDTRRLDPLVIDETRSKIDDLLSLPTFSSVGKLGKNRTKRTYFGAQVQVQKL